MRTDDETAQSDGPKPESGAEGTKPAAGRRSAGKTSGVAGAGGPKAAAKGRAVGRGEGRGAGRGAGRKAKDAPAGVPVSGDAGSAEAADASAGAFKTRDLVDRVARIAGLKRRAAKPLIETVLAELSAALHEGRPLSLRPLGKVTVSKTREAGGGQVLVCRIRQRGPKAATTGAATTSDAALAEVDEGR